MGHNSCAVTSQLFQSPGKSGKGYEKRTPDSCRVWRIKFFGLHCGYEIPHCIRSRNAYIYLGLFCAFPFVTGQSIQSQCVQRQLPGYGSADFFYTKHVTLGFNNALEAHWLSCSKPVFRIIYVPCFKSVGITMTEYSLIIPEPGAVFKGNNTYTGRTQRQILTFLEQMCDAVAKFRRHLPHI